MVETRQELAKEVEETTGTYVTRDIWQEIDRKLDILREYMQKNRQAKEITKLSRTSDFPYFDGTNAKAWIFKAEKYFEANNIEKDERVNLASNHFKGKAATWHQSLMQSFSLRNLCKSWYSYKAQLIDTFTEVCDDQVPETEENLINIGQEIEAGKIQEKEVREVDVNGVVTQAENTPQREYSTKSEFPEETDSTHDTNSSLEVIKIHEKESIEVRDEQFLDDKSILPIQVSNFQLEPSLSLIREEWVAGSNDVLMSVTGSNALMKKEVFGTKKEMVHHMCYEFTLRTKHFSHRKTSLLPKSWKFKFRNKVSKLKGKPQRLLAMKSEILKVVNDKDGVDLTVLTCSEIMWCKSFVWYKSLVDAVQEEGTKTHTLVNGIEGTSVTENYNSADSTLKMLGSFGSVTIGNSTVLENVYRVNVGGKNISPYVDRAGPFLVNKKRMQHTEKKEKDWKFKYRDLDLSGDVKRDIYFLRENNLKGVQQEKKRRFKFLFCKVELSISEELIQVMSLCLNQIQWQLKTASVDYWGLVLSKFPTLKPISLIAINGNMKQNARDKALASSTKASDVIHIIRSVAITDQAVLETGIKRVSTTVELNEFQMMDKKAKSELENKRGGNHKRAEEDLFCVRYMITNEKSKMVYQQEQKIFRIESNEITWIQHQLQQDGYDNIVAERKYMEIMISYIYVSEEILRHQAGNSVGTIQFESCTTQFNRMCMQMRTLQFEQVEIQMFKQRKIPKTWWYKYKNGVSQGPTIMESEFSSSHHSLCGLKFKWAMLFWFGSLPRPPEVNWIVALLPVNLFLPELDATKPCGQGSSICIHLQGSHEAGKKQPGNICMNSGKSFHNLNLEDKVLQGREICCRNIEVTQSLSAHQSLLLLISSVIPDHNTCLFINGSY